MTEVPTHALSLTQPMGTAIVKGWKRVENRSWRPWESMVGKVIAIHASAGWDADYCAFVRDRRPAFQGILDLIGKGMCPQGAIIGIARIDSYVMSTMELADAEDREWFTGRYGWVLTGAREFDQVQCKGMQGLWRIPAAVRDVVASRLAA